MDGNHRVLAHKNMNKRKVLCVVIESRDQSEFEISFDEVKDKKKIGFKNIKIFESFDERKEFICEELEIEGDNRFDNMVLDSIMGTSKNQFR